jgi:hypothetical protein
LKKVISRLIHISELKPFDGSIRMLPGGMVILDATEIENKIIDLYIKELEKYKPRGIDAVAD